MSVFFLYGLGYYVGLEVYDVSGDLFLMGVGVKGKMGVGVKREIMLVKGLVGLMDVEEMVIRFMVLFEFGMVVIIELGM